MSTIEWRRRKKRTRGTWRGGRERCGFDVRTWISKCERVKCAKHICVSLLLPILRAVGLALFFAAGFPFFALLPATPAGPLFLLLTSLFDYSWSAVAARTETKLIAIGLTRCE